MIKLHEDTAALTQMVAHQPLIQRVRGSISREVVNFHLKTFNLGARRGGDVHFLITRLYITGLIKFQTLPQYMLRRHILVLLIEIPPSDGDVKSGGPLVLFEKSSL